MDLAQVRVRLYLPRCGSALFRCHPAPSSVALPSPEAPSDEAEESVGKSSTPRLWMVMLETDTADGWSTV